MISHFSACWSKRKGDTFLTGDFFPSAFRIRSSDPKDGSLVSIKRGGFGWAKGVVRGKSKVRMMRCET